MRWRTNVARRSCCAAILLSVGASGCRTRLEDAFADAVMAADLASPITCPELLVLERSGRLATFDTRTLKFTDAARLSCPARSGTPVTFNVGQDGTGWTFFSD